MELYRAAAILANTARPNGGEQDLRPKFFRNRYSQFRQRLLGRLIRASEAWNDLGRSGEPPTLAALADVPHQLAQLGDGPAHLGVVTRWATPSAVRLDRPEPFLEHGNGVLHGRSVEWRWRCARRSSHRWPNTTSPEPMSRRHAARPAEKWELHGIHLTSRRRTWRTPNGGARVPAADHVRHRRGAPSPPAAPAARARFVRPRPRPPRIGASIAAEPAERAAVTQATATRIQRAGHSAP